jgi:hypothetical protein
VNVVRHLSFKGEIMYDFVYIIFGISVVNIVMVLSILIIVIMINEETTKIKKKLKRRTTENIQND